MTVTFPVQLGTVNSIPIIAEMGFGFGPIPVSVTLTQDYNMMDPPCFPTRPCFTGTAVAQYPHVLPAGYVFSTFAPEAAALVAAGAATYT